MELRFEAFTAQHHLDAQRELFRDCFPENIGTSVESEEHYRWKFHAFPATPPSYEYVAWDAEHRMLGYYAALPFRYRYRGRTFTCGMVCDVMTHSHARGKGVFTKLGRYATAQLQAQGLDFTTGYPIRPEVIPGHLKVGWKVMFDLPLRLKVLKSGAVLRKLRLSMLAPLVDGVLELLCMLARPRKQVGFEASCFDFKVFADLHRDGYERFYERWSSQRELALEKSMEFLQWRLGAPEARYQVISVRKNEELVALSFVRETILKDVPTLAILDVMVLKDAPGALAALYLEMEHYARTRQLETLSVMASGSTSGRLSLTRYGFLRTPFTFKLIVKPLAGLAEMPLDSESAWDLMWMDSDDL